MFSSPTTILSRLKSIQNLCSSKSIYTAVKSAEEIQSSNGYNMGERREQMLEELEKAHIYIEQLHTWLNALEEKLAQLDTNSK